MSAPNFVTIYTLGDGGYYQVVASDMEILDNAVSSYEENGVKCLLRLTQINGAPLRLRVSTIEGYAFSTEETRDNMFRLERMSAQEKQARGDFDS